MDALNGLCKLFLATLLPHNTMDALVALYRQAQVDPDDSVTLRVDTVCTSPALALLRAHLHDKPMVTLLVETPAPVDAAATLLHVHRFRHGTLVYVAYITAEAAMFYAAAEPTGAPATHRGDDSTTDAAMKED
jgi:hypothetical protein